MNFQFIFFSETEFDVVPLHIFFKSLKKVLGISKIDFQQSFNRNLFFLHLKSGILKTEFTYFPFLRIEQGMTKYGVVVDSLFTIYQRTKARDYIDLYMLCRQEKYTITDLIKKAKIKFDWRIDPLQLGAQFVKAGEAEDYPRLIKKIQPQVWQRFFINEAKKLGREIIS